MSKHYLSKSALLLSVLLAAGANQAVQAEEQTGSVAVENTNSGASSSATGLVTETTDTSSDQDSTPSEAFVATTKEAEAPNNLEEAPLLAPADLTANLTTSDEAKETAPVEGQTVDVRILSTTDLHTNLVNYDYYQDKPAQNLGLAKTAVLIEEAKAENSNVILVDNGDTIQGTPLGTYKSTVDPVEAGEQHPMYKALSALGFDAGTLGNHEFNYGLPYLETVIASAGLPLLNANVLDAATGQPLFQTHSIVSKNFTDTLGNPVTLKIGITGITPPQILNWDKSHLEGKVTVRDAVEALQELVPKIRQEGADIVLVLSHSGIGDDKYEKGEENVGYQIAGIPGVDAVVTGHSHAEFPAGGKGFYSRYAGVDDVNGLINGTPVTMAGKYGDHLGVIDLNLTYTNGKWQTNTAKGQIRKIDTKSETTDPRILELAKDAHDGTVNYVRQQVGTTTAPITSYFALVKDDPSVQIVNNAQVWYVKQELAGTPEGNLPILSAAAPFKAGGRNFNDATNFTDIPAGPIAIKNVADLYLYDNVTAILRLTGADIKEWLEMSAGQFNQIDPTKTEAQDLINPDFRTYNFDVIDGVTYLYDVTQPAKYDRSGKLINPEASRLRDLRYQGQPIDDAQEFIVVTNNYRANGSFPGVVNASLNKVLKLENRQAIIDYIISEKTINPSADNNWGFTDSIKGLDIRFLSADRAKLLADNYDDITYLNPVDSNEGFAQYRLVYVEAKTPDTTDGKLPLNPMPFPGSNPKPTPRPLSEPERLEIEQMVTKAYQELVVESPKPLSQPAVAKTARQNVLPATGTSSSLTWMSVGLGLLGLLGLAKKRKNRLGE
ncbi:2',3'-cyclic-nucleotide 2'-phosphodiesterase/3'-nucleotidase [Streptococcus rupicaprae]|uniref:2',3'-cyclic-nucleotide 2'-phosphodiesterase/3'-nucleotidase n=1 Tax=Streptococcus rupicaprae TaxID=759619 RepID=A0ABV2FGD0_9STRE